jgi:hypothetical protein
MNQPVVGLKHVRGCILIALAMPIIIVCACGETDQKRWDDFWGPKKGGGRVSLLGKRAGDTEEWTIECNEYRGGARREMADSMATALKAVSALSKRPIWTEHAEESSRLFCGSYTLKYSTPKPGSAGKPSAEPEIQLNDAIRHDLDLIRGLAIGDKYPFFSARPRPKPLPDEGPTEWDLRNAKGVYTLNVGVTQSTPTLHNYKEAAVEWVKDLRQRGYEAYYYHSPDRPITSICVGTFGEDAVTVGSDRVPHYSQTVLALREKEEFKYNLENGAITYKSATAPDGKHARVANESFLVKIPKKADPAAVGSPRR